LFAYVIIPFIGQKSGFFLLLMIILALCTCIAVWITGKVLCSLLSAYIDFYVALQSILSLKNGKFRIFGVFLHV